MFLFKFVAVIALSLLTFQVLRFVIAGLKAAKVRVNPKQRARTMTRLTQDPRTGIYYPEH